MIFFCGDVHGNFEHVIQTVITHSPAAIIFLGDLQCQRPLEIELEKILDKTDVWFIHGNHDTDSDADFDHLFNSALRDKNLHGRVVDIDGRRVAGLGGIFRGQIWRPPEFQKYDTRNEFDEECAKKSQWSNDLSRKHHSSIFLNDYFALINQKADILVTHEAPACHPHGFNAIDDLAKNMGVDSAFHGHHHDRLDYSGSYLKLGFKAFGVGFRGISDENGCLIRKGDFDEIRSQRKTG